MLKFKNLNDVDKKLFNFLIRTRFLFSIISSIIFIFFLFLSIKFKVDNNYRLLREFSEFFSSLAIYTLAFILFIKPILRILNLRIFYKYLVFRRELGILTFYFAFIHAFSEILIFIPLANTNVLFSLLKQYLTSSLNIFLGFLTLLILFLLYATSNNISMKILKRCWKYLHYLAYLALLLAFIHAYLMENDLFYLALAILFVVLKILEFFRFIIKK